RLSVEELCKIKITVGISLNAYRGVRKLAFHSFSVVGTGQPFLKGLKGGIIVLRYILRNIRGIYGLGNIRCTGTKIIMVNSALGYHIIGVLVSVLICHQAKIQIVIP